MKTEIKAVERQDLPKGFRFVGYTATGDSVVLRKCATQPYTHATFRGWPGVEKGFWTFHSSVKGAHSTPYNQVVFEVIQITAAHQEVA